MLNLNIRNTWTECGLGIQGLLLDWGFLGYHLDLGPLQLYSVTTEAASVDLPQSSWAAMGLLQLLSLITQLLLRCDQTHNEQIWGCVVDAHCISVSGWQQCAGRGSRGLICSFVTSPRSWWTLWLSPRGWKGGPPSLALGPPRPLSNGGVGGKIRKWKWFITLLDVSHTPTLISRRVVMAAEKRIAAISVRNGFSLPCEWGHLGSVFTRTCSNARGFTNAAFRAYCPRIIKSRSWC